MRWMLIWVVAERRRSSGEDVIAVALPCRYSSGLASRREETFRAYESAVLTSTVTVWQYASYLPPMA